MEKLQGSSFGDGEAEEYDVVVVGSGYGGSVVACRLSMAGGRSVCLLEKGRRWEAKDFPTDSFKLLSASRVESRNLGLSLGSKDALIQVCMSLIFMCTCKKNVKFIFNSHIY